MVLDALLAYAHFTALFIMVSFIGAEAMLLRTQPGALSILALARSDSLLAVTHPERLLT